MDTKDVISEVFSTLRIASEIYFRARLSGQFSIQIQTEKRRIRFHLVMRGSCWLCVDGDEPVFLSEGNIALVPNGASQILSASPQIAPVSLTDLIAGGALNNQTLRVGDGVESAALLCGFCRFDEDIDHPVIANLPSLIHLRFQDLGAEPWLTATMRLIALEADLNTQGTSAVLGRMIEVAVIQATRQLAKAGESWNIGFISALSDAALSKSLFAIHRHPEKNWRVGDLAAVAGMSRASFAKKFMAEVGSPPLEYLTDWRLMRARSLLSDTALSIEEIAKRCGYASLPSFSRRFKQRYNIGPGTFRRAGVKSGL